MGMITPLVRGPAAFYSIGPVPNHHHQYQWYDASHLSSGLPVYSHVPMHAQVRKCAVRCGASLVS